MSKWRSSSAYHKWRKKVIARDKNCKICKKKENLEAHHIFHATYFPKLRYKISNGVCLCKGCHTQFHTNFKKSFRAKCDKKDWENFKTLVKYIKKLCKEGQWGSF